MPAQCRPAPPAPRPPGRHGTARDPQPTPAGATQNARGHPRPSPSAPGSARAREQPRSGPGETGGAVSDGRASLPDRDLGSGTGVPVLPVSAAGAGQSRFFLGKQGVGAGAGGSRRDWGWDRGRHRRGREEPLRDERWDPATEPGDAGAGPARRPVLPWSSRWIAAGSRQGAGTAVPATGPSDTVASRPVGHRAPGPGSPAATGLPASSSARLSRVRILGGALPNKLRDGRWDRLQLCPVWEWRRPGRHMEMLQPGQRPLTAQKNPEEQLALSGNGTGCLQRGSDSNSCFSPPSVPMHLPGSQLEVQKRWKTFAVPQWEEHELTAIEA
ncbi:translation initiation factor IF-2-like [Passer montanus]|uniref:translation initiation factor IF-2-like n=1 Tax=Passer montanus TaxID=9160 RepID=UPI00195F3CE1|nr:translation initiation factor IF-2-like [Passer montanus]